MVILPDPQMTALAFFFAIAGTMWAAVLVPSCCPKDVLAAHWPWGLLQ